MIVSYSRDASLREAISMTFDGEHPCSLCKVIKQGRSEEKQQDQQQVKPGTKLELGLVWQTTPFNFACLRESIPSPDSQALSWREAPPKPRPRSVAV